MLHPGLDWEARHRGCEGVYGHKPPAKAWPAVLGVQGTLPGIWSSPGSHSTRNIVLPGRACCWVQLSCLSDPERQKGLSQGLAGILGPILQFIKQSKTKKQRRWDF